MTIIYRTTNASEWGSGKGSNLTPEQVDNNFWEVQKAIAAIEIKEGVGIESAFVVDGNQLYFNMTDGSVVGPIEMPTVTLNPRGEWRSGIAYAVNDLFTYNGSVYLVKVNHTAAALFDPNANDGAGHNYYGLLIENPGNQLPKGGQPGQVVTKNSTVDFKAEWTTPRYVPGGGDKENVLVKLSETPYDYAWAKIATVPPLGSTGEYLSKKSGSDFDFEWTSKGIIPPGGDVGDVLTKTWSEDFYFHWRKPHIPINEVAVISNNSYTFIKTMEGDVFKIYVQGDTQVAFTDFVNKEITLIFVAGTTPHTVYFQLASFRAAGSLYVSASSGSLYVVRFVPLAERKYVEMSRTGPIT